MDALQEAIKKRDDFLKANPHMMQFQQKLDGILDKCRTEDRLSVITMLMMQNMIDLQKETINLKNYVNTL